MDLNQPQTDIEYSGVGYGWVLLDRILESSIERKEPTLTRPDGFRIIEMNLIQPDFEGTLADVYLIIVNYDYVIELN